MAGKSRSPAVEISRILQGYEEEERETIQKCMHKTGLYCKRILKATSPGSGEYASGWKARMVYKGMLVTSQVFNGRAPGLTHLLENPHEIQNKWGSYGRTRPGHGQTPHIAAAQEQAEEYLLELLTKSL